MKLCYVLVIFWLALGLMACGNGEDTGIPLSAAEQAEYDSVWTVLNLLDRTAIDRAFSHLPTYAYTRTTRLEQPNAEGQILAMQEYSVSFDGPDHTPRLIQTSTNGAFSDSFWSDDDEAGPTPEDTTALAGLMLSVEPVFLSSRGRESYSYRSLADTMWDQVAVRRLEVSARPGTGDGETLRNARLYLDAASNALIGMDVHQVLSSFLYEEDSRFHVQLQKGPDAVWLPRQWRVDTRIRTLFFEPLHFRRQAVYGEFDNN
jgi:hypothetical protein